jgi:hypothetical protein
LDCEVVEHPPGQAWRHNIAAEMLSQGKKEISILFAPVARATIADRQSTAELPHWEFGPYAARNARNSGHDHL